MIDRTGVAGTNQVVGVRAATIVEQAKDLSVILYLALGLWLAPSAIVGVVAGLYGWIFQGAVGAGLVAVAFHTFVPWGKWSARLGLPLNTVFSVLVGVITTSLTYLIGLGVSGVF